MPHSEDTGGSALLQRHIDSKFAGLRRMGALGFYQYDPDIATVMA